jgi:hypothetical protein
LSQHENGGETRCRFQKATARTSEVDRTARTIPRPCAARNAALLRLFQRRDIVAARDRFSAEGAISRVGVVAGY